MRAARRPAVSAETRRPSEARVSPSPDPPGAGQGKGKAGDSRLFVSPTPQGSVLAVLSHFSPIPKPQEARTCDFPGKRYQTSANSLKIHLKLSTTHNTLKRNTQHNQQKNTRHAPRNPRTPRKKNTQEKKKKHKLLEKKTTQFTTPRQKKTATLSTPKKRNSDFILKKKSQLSTFQLGVKGL